MDDLATHEHRYPIGWTSEGLDEALPGHLWTQETNEMSAWRFCPPCGKPLKAPYAASLGPVCTGCDREFDACPCGCVTE